MAQTISRWALTLESRVRSKAILCEICGELGGIGQVSQQGSIILPLLYTRSINHH